MTKGFASTADTAEKTVSFDEVGRGLYAYTAEGDPNSGIIVGDDAVMVVDAQATPAMAQQVIERVRKVTDKPIKYVLLTHYHAVRVLGASAYKGAEILCSDIARDMIVERGRQDMDSEIGRFPRLFRAVESIPGLTWPSITFARRMSVWLGKREVRIMHLGRAHTAGDVVAWVPDARVVFSGDLVEYRSACYCGDAHFTDWPATLDRLSALGAQAMVPGRGAALGTPAKTAEGIAMTRDFLGTLYGAVGRSVAAGHSLKQAFGAARTVMDPKFSSFAIYEHCLPFNVARAFDEAKGIDHPVIWTAERDREMWAALQG
jgi:glyoxylase-like metal-dependent hydrolase (beta-lactamase superfamily II)